MKVKELKEILSKYSDDADIKIITSYLEDDGTVVFNNKEIEDISANNNKEIEILIN